MAQSILQASTRAVWDAGVYAVGRPEVGQLGWWMAAVLRCGPRAVLSHQCAGCLYGILEAAPALTVSVPPDVCRRAAGIVVHRRLLAEGMITEHDGIPVTTPVRTLVDLATKLDDRELEAAINKADAEDLIDPESLRAAIEPVVGTRGVPRLRRVLDRRTFTLTDSELERRFLPLVRRAGLRKPLTRQRLNGFTTEPRRNKRAIACATRRTSSRALRAVAARLTRRSQH